MMSLRLSIPASRPASAHLQVSLTTCVAAGFLLIGCGGGSHNGQTVDVPGIVLSYPETLSGAVTEADLTPVGAGTTVGVFALADQEIGTPPYYKKHALPQTDTNGRFTLKYDMQGGTPLQESLYVADRCSVTPTVLYIDGSVQGYPYLGSNVPSHFPKDQLLNAGKLADAVKAKYHVTSVIVVSNRADACGTPQLPQ